MNSQKKILFVTRDKKPGMIGRRIAHELQRRGMQVVIRAEKPSVAEWQKLEPLDLYVIGENEPQSDMPAEVLREENPDVLVVGLSSPMGKEEDFVRAMAMTNLNKPVVALDDNWGSTFRCKHPADLVLTIDELGKRLIEQNLAYAHHDYKVEIIGDLSATAASEPIPQATIDAFNAAKGDAEYVFILASQKWTESDDIVDIGLASCVLSLKAGAKLVVIPRFHPGAKPEDRERWNKKIVEFSLEFPEAVNILGDSSINTDHLATLADGVFAVTGSALRAAAYAWKIPLCVWTERLGEKLKAESGMRHHPLTIGNSAFELCESYDIVQLIRKHGSTVRAAQKELLQPVQFNAVKAANAILEIAK